MHIIVLFVVVAMLRWEHHQSYHNNTVMQGLKIFQLMARHNKNNRSSLHPNWQTFGELQFAFGECLFLECL